MLYTHTFHQRAQLLCFLLGCFPQNILSNAAFDLGKCHAFAWKALTDFHFHIRKRKERIKFFPVKLFVHQLWKSLWGEVVNGRASKSFIAGIIQIVPKSFRVTPCTKSIVFPRKLSPGQPKSSAFLIFQQRRIAFCPGKNRAAVKRHRETVQIFLQEFFCLAQKGGYHILLPIANQNDIERFYIPMDTLHFNNRLHVISHSICGSQLYCYTKKLIPKYNKRITTTRIKIPGVAVFKKFATKSTNPFINAPRCSNRFSKRDTA